MKKRMIDFKNRMKSATIEALTYVGESVMLGAGAWHFEKVNENPERV